MRVVKLGLFFDLRNPDEWARPWSALYGRTLEHLEGAEALGLRSAWFSEHHLFADGYLPQPLTFLAAVAARTRTMTIGTAVLLALLRPAPLVAEEAAIVDQISGGRLQLGIGAGYSPREFALYDTELSGRHRRTDAIAAEVRDLLDGGGVTPPAVQNPFPIWLGYQGPRGARRAGRLGLGLLSLDRSLLAPYREGLSEGGHDPSAARTGGMLDIIIADDPERAFALVLPHFVHQTNSYAECAAAGSPSEPRRLTSDDVLARRTGPTSVRGLQVLTPDDAVAAIHRATSGSPVEHAFLWSSVAAMPDEISDRHVELLCTRVAPAVEALHSDGTESRASIDPDGPPSS